MAKFDWVKFHRDLDIALAIYFTEVSNSPIDNELIKFLEFSNKKRLT